jgi:hypothetical protein
MFYNPCKGSFVREITTNGFINYNLLYNERNDQLLLRQDERLCCINLDGHVTYIYDISGARGLALDQQGHVYISGGDSHASIKYKDHSSIKYKNPSFTKYKNHSSTKYKNPSFTKYKNHSFTTIN